MSELTEICLPVCPSPLDAYRGRDRSATVIEEPKTVDDAFIFEPRTELSAADVFIAVVDKAFQPPKKATDALFTYLHIVEKEIEPLINRVKDWVLKELNDEERMECEKLINEGSVESV